MPYTETAVSPPRRTRMMFSKMDVTRPAMLFRKLGLPQATICRTIRAEKRGRHRRSSALPRKNGTKESAAHTAMPRQVANAAAQMPQPSTPRNRNSSTALSALIRMFSIMLPRM